MIYNDKKFQKKVIKLITAIKKCAMPDLELFVALCILKFDLKDNDLESENTHFQNAIYLYKHFKDDVNIVNLIR